MKIHKNVTVTFKGQSVKADVEEWGRKGTMSPTTFIIVYKGRRIVPYARRRDDWELGLNFLFMITYSDAMHDLIYKENPLLRMISKDRSSGSMYHQPVILGVEHGVVFPKEKP